MREIDTGALDRVALAMGIGAPSTATRLVAFDDDYLQQVLDVGPLIRRSVSPKPLDGLYMANLQNEHAAADSTEEFSLDPYSMEQTGGGLIGGLWPAPIPPGMDVWIISLSGIQSGGAAADFESGLLDIQWPVEANAFDSAASLSTVRTMNVASFNGVLSLINGTVRRLTQVGTGLAELSPCFRVPRGGNIRWRTRNKNAGAQTLEMHIGLGLMAAGLGQDGVG